MSSEFVIQRVFPASRERVFAAFADVEHLKRWWGPKGFTMRSGTMDLRPGGVFHYCLISPQGQEMWGKWVFREVVAPERFVHTSAFSDAEGNLTRHPGNPAWPLEMLSSATFTEENGQTTLTIRATALGATDAEQQAFDAGHTSMAKGFAGTLDQLEEHLSASAG